MMETERPDRPGRRSNAVRAVDHIIQKALLDTYYKMFTGGDTNDSRNRREAT